MRFKAFLCTLCLLTVLLCGCTRQDACQVAATTLPVYQFTSAICEGTGITVTQLITQQVSCLHDYSLNVSQVRTLEEAQVVVISGGGLEDFMEDSLQQADHVIDSSEAENFRKINHYSDKIRTFLYNPQNKLLTARNFV